MLKLDPDQVQRLAEAMSEIQAIDSKAQYLGSMSSDGRKRWGHNIKLSIGQTILGLFSDQMLGDLFVQALLQGLNERRKEIQKTWGDYVDF